MRREEAKLTDALSTCLFIFCLDRVTVMGKPSSTSKSISRKTLALKDEDEMSLSNPAQIESQMQRLLEVRLT